MDPATDSPAAAPALLAECTQERIVDAATRVLGANLDASMLEVAAACGVGRATVYRHFANRDELVRAIRLRALRDCRAALDPEVFAQASVREALGAVLATLVPVLDRYRVLLDAPPPDRSDPEQRALTDAIEQPLRELIVRGQAGGELDARFPPDFVIAVLIGVLRAARQAVATGRMSAEAAHALAVRSMLAGVGSSTSSSDH
jgi:TetR/AcrR family transcriptional regulator, mexCD-oprJ operon repressor